MNSLKTRLLTIAAAAVVAAGTASAQVALTATVPFPFSAGANKNLAAGDYTIRHAAGVWYLTSNETRHTAQAAQMTDVYSATGENPRLVFHCRANACRLVEIAAGGGEVGARFSEPKPRREDAGELARVVVVPLNAANSD